MAPFAWCELGRRIGPGLGAFCALLFVGVVGATPLAYVPSSDSPELWIIDTATDTVVATLALPAPASGVAIDRNGQRVYLAGGNRLTVVDTMTRSVSKSVEIDGAFAVAVNPDGTRAYVSRASGPPWPRPIAVVDTSSGAVVDTIPLGSQNVYSGGMHVDAAGGALFVTHMNGGGSSGVTIIDLATHKVIGGAGFFLVRPVGIALSPDGTTLYVACEGIGTPRDHSSGTLVIDVATGQVVGSLATVLDPVFGATAAPHTVALDSSGRRAFVTTSHGLWVFDTTSRALIARSPGGRLAGVALHPDGQRIYAANRGGDAVNVYDAATLEVKSTVRVGSSPVALGMFIWPPASGSPQPLAATDVPTLAPIALASMAALVVMLGAAFLRRRTA